MKRKPIRSSPVSRLTLDQPKALNNLLEEDIYALRSRPWEIYVSQLTIITAVVVPWLGIHVCLEWLAGKPFLHSAIKDLFGLLAVCFVLFCLEDIGLHLQYRIRRRIDMCLDGLCFSRGSLLPWAGILNWSLTSVPNEPKMQKLTISYDLTQIWNPKDIKICLPFLKPRPRPRRYFILLQHPEQTDALKKEICSVEMAGTNIPSLKDVSFPPPWKPSQIPALACLVAAFWLWSSSVPAAVIGISFASSTTNATRDKTRPTPNEQKVIRWKNKLFPNQNEAAAAFMILATILLVLGIFLYLYGRAINGGTLQLPDIHSGFR